MVVFVVTRPKVLDGTLILYLKTLTLNFNLLLKNFNFGHNFHTRRDRAQLWCYTHNRMTSKSPHGEPHAWKICYDKAGNLPNKGRNFNTQTWGKVVYFLFIWLVGIGFRQNFFRVLPNFGDFGAKMSFFHYVINQNRYNFIKHCSPPCTKKPLISEMCIYIKSSLCKWGLGTGGGTMFYRQKTKGGVGLKHTKYVIANGKLRQSSTFW